MHTVAETEQFIKMADKIWSEEEREEFIEFISNTPNAGKLIVGAEGARKVRWTSKGTGKSGGVRVITWIQIKDTVTLIAIYKKSRRSTMKAHEIKKVK
ncbi:MAG: DNA-binding protein [Pseudohongiella sp.]|nr:DNA-binding protein [Pseudohongiella sp.]